MSNYTLYEKYRENEESGIITGFDGSLESLVHHLNESNGEEAVEAEVNDVHYYGWCVDNHITIVMARRGRVVGVVENRFNRATSENETSFEWGEKIEFEELKEGIFIRGKKLFDF